MIGISSPELSINNYEERIAKVSKYFEHWEFLTLIEPYLQNALPVFLDVCQSYDISYSIHTPIFDVNLASTDETIRNRSIDQIKSTIAIGHKMGVDLFVVHPGIYDSLNMTKEKSMNCSKKSFLELDKVSEEFSIKLCIENMNCSESNLGRTFKEILFLIEETELEFCLDTGHALTNNQLENFFKLKDRIINLHLHDNDGFNDIHLPLGDGILDTEGLLRELINYDGNHIVETRNLNEGIRSKLYLLDKMINVEKSSGFI